MNDPVRPLQVIELESLRRSIIPGVQLTEDQCYTLYKYQIPYYPVLSVTMKAIDDCISELKII